MSEGKRFDIDWKNFKQSSAVPEHRPKDDVVPKEAEPLISVEDALRASLTQAEAELIKVRVILADIIRALSETELAEVKFERARKKGINYCFEKGTA